MRKIFFIVFIVSLAFTAYAQEESIFGTECAVTGENFSKDEEHSIWIYEKASLTLENISLKDAYAKVVKDLNDKDTGNLYHYKLLYKKYPEMPKKSVSIQGNMDKDAYAPYKCNIDIAFITNKKIKIKISAFDKTGIITLEQIGSSVQVVRKTAVLDLHTSAARHNPENKPGSITNGWQKVDSYFGAIEFLCSGEKAKENEIMAQSFNTCDACIFEKYFKNMDIKEAYNALFKNIPKTMKSFPKDLPLSNRKIENEWYIHEFTWKKNRMRVSESSKETEEYYTDIEFIQEKDGVKVQLSGYGIYPK